MSADEWQPIETAPRDGTRIDLWVVSKPSKRRINVGRPEVYGTRCTDAAWLDGAWRDEKGDAVETQNYWFRCRVTHWMPVPQPPPGTRG